MHHVLSWANQNKMAVNLLKTVELVFHRPSISHDILPTELPDVKRVTVAKLLGVFLRHDLNFIDHVESVIATCNQRLYLLAQLSKQGLGITAIDYIFQAIVLNKILYALPVYYGYLTERQKHQLQQVCNRAKRRFLTLSGYDIEVLAEKAEYSLFRQSTCEGHCLHHIYEVNDKPAEAMRLRERGHNFLLPRVTYEFNKKNFITRCLYKYI